MDEVTVATYLYRGEAEIGLLLLAAAGIPARVVADDEGGLSPGFFVEHRVRLVVLGEHEDAAGAVLQAEAPG
jgi:hypothetical protein